MHCGIFWQRQKKPHLRETLFPKNLQIMTNYNYCFIYSSFSFTSTFMKYEICLILFLFSWVKDKFSCGKMRTNKFKISCSVILEKLDNFTQSTITCLKLTIETLDQDVKYVQS